VLKIPAFAKRQTVSGNYSTDPVKTNDMDKGQILKGLSEIQQELTATKKKLHNLV
jgi:hypothetical protein